MPSPQSSSPKRATRSARTPGPATRNGTGSPEWITSGEVGVAWSPVTQTTRREDARRGRERAVEALDRLALDPRVLGVAGLVGGLEVAEDEGGAAVERPPGALEPSCAGRRPGRRPRAPGRSSSRGGGRGRRGTATPPTITPSRPWRSRKHGAGRRRPHHLSVTTPVRTARHPGAGRGGRARTPPAPHLGRPGGRRGLGQDGGGRITGWRSRKNGSVSVTPSCAPPVTRRIPSPGPAGASRVSRPSPPGRGPRGAGGPSRPSAGVGSARSPRGRSSRRSARRSAAKASTSSPATSGARGRGPP